MARPAGDINAGSMADIAFLLLIFWLVTTTMDVDAGLSRRLPPMPDPNQKIEDIQVNRRNIMDVRISSRDNIYAFGKPIEVSMLKDMAKEFIANPTDDPTKPEKEIKQIEGLGPYSVSRGIISLLNDRSTSYDVYIKVQNELVKAYSELRDEFAGAQYGKKFIALTEDQKDIVRKVYPQNISEAEPRDVSKK